MKHLFVSYDIAKQLKAIGFDEPCFTFYDKGKLHHIEDDWINCTNGETFLESENCTAPTHQQVVDWFREKHGVTITILQSFNKGLWLYDVVKDGHSWRSDPIDGYYAALNAAIDEAINLIKI